MVAARTRRNEARELLAEGQDPGVQRGAERQHCVTFEMMAREWHSRREESLDPAHARRLMSRLERDAFPALGPTPIRELTAPINLEIRRTI